MPKAYLYIRYSTAEQGEGDSVERQTSLATNFVKNRPDLDLELVSDPVFVDAGVSSFIGDNMAPDKGLGRFIAAIRTGEIAVGSALLVESLDRLSRQEIARAQALFNEIMLQGITIITTSPTESHVYNGQAGFLDFMIMLVHSERAHQESALKSRRVKHAWISKRQEAQQGKIITRICPHWLKVSRDGQKFEVIEERAQVVKEIFSLAETMGYQSIARYLNETGIKPFSERSRGWQSSVIVKILLNPAVVGTYQPRSIEHVRTENGNVRRTRPEGLPIEGYYPAVVPRKTFERIQLLITARSKKHAGRKGAAISNLFSYVAECGLCGGNMVLVKKGGGQGSNHLVCTIARRGAGCTYQSWPYEALESSFLDYCQNIDLSQLLPSSSDDDKAKDLKREFEEVKARIRSIESANERLMKNVIANGGEIPLVIQKHMLDSDKERGDLEIKLVELNTEIADEENRQDQQQVFAGMFANIKAKLASSTGPELFRIRSELQKAIRHSVIGLRMYHTPENLSNKLREQKPNLPKITHHYHIVFRVGVKRGLYFHKKTPVLLIDNEQTAEGYVNLKALPYQPKPHHSVGTKRGRNGRWKKGLVTA